MISWVWLDFPGSVLEEEEKEMRKVEDLGWKEKLDFSWRTLEASTWGSATDRERRGQAFLFLLDAPRYSRTWTLELFNSFVLVTSCKPMATSVERAGSIGLIWYDVSECCSYVQLVLSTFLYSQSGVIPFSYLKLLSYLAIHLLPLALDDQVSPF